MKKNSTVNGIMILFLNFCLLIGCFSTKKMTKKSNPNPEATPQHTTAENAQEEKKSEQSPLMSLFVEPEWLKDHLADTNLLIIDARGFPAQNAALYLKGHIPGAINASYPQFMTPFSDPIGEGWGNILPVDQLSKKLAEIGVTHNKMVIVYADNTSSDPAPFGQDGRLIWTLRMAGLENTKILNGGFPRWIALGYATATDSIKPVSSNFTATSLDESYRVSTDYLKQNNNVLKIIDSRAQDEYDGAQKYKEPRGGHLPQALSFHFTHVLNSDNCVKKPQEIEEMLGKKGIEKNDDIAIYCTTGIRSAYLALVLRTLGYSKAKNYDDSFVVWASDQTLTLE